MLQRAQSVALFTRTSASVRRPPSALTRSDSGHARDCHHTSGGGTNTMDASDPPHTAQSTDPTEPLLWMLNGHCLQQALHVVAVLGIADLLASGPKDVINLAEATRAHPTALLRLLRALASVGVFAEDSDGAFALTPLGTTLRVD